MSDWSDGKSFYRVSLKALIRNERGEILMVSELGSGLSLVAVFAGFITNHDATIQSIGFALAIGVLVDAFIVRLVIVPIVMSYLGKSAWWIPKWLNKVLPNISIEGDESRLK
jgi:hypothetical protein